MRNIETLILNPSDVYFAERMLVCTARLTQRGSQIKSIDDFVALYDKPFSQTLVENMTRLPHPTIQKFAVINAVVVGASRRFLAQVTRHQNEVKFMSASLQYSDYSGKAGYVVPYELLDTDYEKGYLAQCEAAMQKYMSLVQAGIDHDACGYLAPQSLRNVLVISATPYQWKHMIHQRTCRRNTPETRYVFLKIWKELYTLSPALFAPESCGAFCQQGTCKEGKMGCGEPIQHRTPTDILKADFPKLTQTEESENG